MIPNPLVSVIIPTYNRSWGLKRAAASVLAQSFGDFELLIVDDASSDDTECVSHQIAAADGRVRYVRQPFNVGVARNWGTGVELARGEFVALLMDDDYYKPTFLQRRVAALRGDPAAVLAFSDYRIVPEDAGLPERNIAAGDGRSKAVSGSELFLAALTRRIFVGATLYRARPVRDVWPRTLEAAEIVDYAVNLELTRIPGSTGHYLDGADFIASEHPAQISTKKFGPIFPAAERLHRRLLSERILGPVERRMVRDELYQWYLQWARYQASVSGVTPLTLSLMWRAIQQSPCRIQGWRFAAGLMGKTVGRSIGLTKRGAGGEARSA